jgi:hypothetical protein
MNFRVKGNRANRIVTVKSLMPAILKEMNIEESFAIESIRELWKNIVDGIISSHSMPDRIFRDILFVSVDHPVYSNEIALMKGMLLQRLREEHGLLMINDIRVEVKRLVWR